MIRRLTAAAIAGASIGAALWLLTGLHAPRADARSWDRAPRSDDDRGRTWAAPAQDLLPYRLVDVIESEPGPRPAGFVRRPAGVAVAADGTVYLVDTDRGVVHVLRGDTWVGPIGTPGVGPGQLREPRGVAWVAGRIAVADTGNRRVQWFGADGTPQGSWTGIGTPWDVAPLPGGGLAVTDHDGDRVHLLDAAGGRRASLGATGTGWGDLDGPTGLSAWPDGRLAVVDGLDRVQVWSPDGAVIAVFTNTTAAPFVDVAAVGDSGVVVAAMRQMRGYDVAGGRQSVAVAPTPGAFLGVATSATGVASGTVWAAMVWDDRTGLRQVDASTLGALADRLGLPSPAGELIAPRRLATAEGHVFVLDAAPRVQRLSTAGGPAEQVPMAVADDLVPLGGWDLVTAEGVAVRRGDGVTTTWEWRPPTTTLWIAALDRHSGNATTAALDVRGGRVVSFAGDGTLAQTVTLRSAAGRRDHALTDLAVRPGGGALVVNRTERDVEVRDADGSLVATWPVVGVPLRVARDGSGGAFVLTREGWVWRLGPDGRPQAYIDVGSDGVGGRAQPSDLAVDASGRLYVADAGGNRILVYAADPGGPPPNAPAGAGCTFVRDKRAWPRRVQLGESVGVTLTVAGECLNRGQGADVMLVVDASGSMAGRKIDAARQAAVAFVTEMDFDVSRVGVVTFSSESRLASVLTTDARAVIGALTGFGQPLGGTDIGEAVELAAAHLAAEGRPGLPRVVVLMTDGRPEGADVDADAAAEAARAAGVRMYSIGFGADVDPDLLQRMAGSDGDYFFAPHAAQLYGIYTEIARRISGGVLLRTATVTDVVPANMRYVVDSARPPVASYENRVLRWELTGVTGDVVLSYRLVPLAVGTWPTNERAAMRYRDGLDEPGDLVFPVPTVDVWAPSLPPVPLYLPLLAAGGCVPVERRTDVVLVIDTSSTMTGDKLEAARGAARLLVGRLDLTRDRAAVVGFNRAAVLAAGLTGDRAALDAAIGSLSITPGTAIDSGLRTALDELRGPRARPDATRAVVLLSDGMNNAGPDPVRAAASELASAGVMVYVAAFGADADLALLAEVAREPGRLFVALTPDDLERIYAEIAGAIACR